MSNIWDKVNGTIFEEPIRKIQKELTEVSFNSWILSILNISKEGHVLYVTVRDQFTQGILKARYSSLLTNAFSETGIDSIDIIVESCNIIGNGAASIMPAEQARKIADANRAKPIDIELKVSEILKGLTNKIDFAISKGNYEAITFVETDLKDKDEIYAKVVEHMIDKNYSIKLENEYIKISW